MMAKLQRGVSQPASEELVEAGEMSESGEDEGPDEVAFDESRTAALRSAEEARRSAKREKELLKEKRRKRQLFFQEQKKKRLLPETLLEEFDTVPQKQKKLSDDKDEKQETEQNKEETTSQKKVSKSLQGKYSVLRVKDKSTDATLQQSAMDFIQARLYGSGTQRTTNAELLSLEKKRGVNQGAAVQFANKQLGAEQKAKAEKCNKRFIHKNKLIPS